MEESGGKLGTGCGLTNRSIEKAGIARGEKAQLVGLSKTVIAVLSLLLSCSGVTCWIDPRLEYKGNDCGCSFIPCCCVSCGWV